MLLHKAVKSISMLSDGRQCLPFVVAKPLQAVEPPCLPMSATHAVTECGCHVGQGVAKIGKPRTGFSSLFVQAIQDWKAGELPEFQK